MAYTLIADQITHRFGRNILFDKLSFTVEEGEVLTITGPNGSGKSTLMRIVAGVLTPSDGTVYLKSDEHLSSSYTLQVGYVAPYLNVYNDFTAYENLLFIAQARGIKNPAHRIMTLLERVQLIRHAHQPVKTFSSGMKQRIRYAAALLHHPPLLLLDEPTTTLDEAGRQLVRDLIEEQRDEGTIVLLATNQPEEAAYGDRTLHIPDFRATPAFRNVQTPM